MFCCVLYGMNFRTFITGILSGPLSHWLLLPRTYAPQVAPQPFHAQQLSLRDIDGTSSESGRLETHAVAVVLRNCASRAAESSTLDDRFCPRAIR